MDMPQLIEIKNGDKVKGTFSAEEMAARLAGLRAHLAEAGIDFEIVPGVTAAIAAAEYSGIMLTHRD